MNTERVVVNTGAAGGIGALLAGRFLCNGDTVIATDVSDEALKALAERTGRHSELHTIATDISSEPDTEHLADFARQVFGRVDVVVNAAGHFPVQPFEEILLTPGGASSRSTSPARTSSFAPSCH